MIDYRYVIVHSDTENGYMHVRYFADGKQDITIGVRLPTKDETVDQVVHQAFPGVLQQWCPPEHVPVAVGHSGVYTYTPPTKDPKQELAELEALNAVTQRNLRELMIRVSELETLLGLPAHTAVTEKIKLSDKLISDKAIELSIRKAG